MRRNPFDELEDMIDRMSRQFEGGVPGNLPTVGGVAIDVADRDEEYVVTADLPGYETDDIDVTVTEGRLRIEAERETGTAEEGEDYIFNERRRESVSRTVRLPEPVDEDAVKAKYTNGVLTVTLPKEEMGDEGHHIEIE
ncbi:MAG TPA: archaeal heat shock protein Hsp14 [Natrialbaceae archaeon]|nr:archaeal heat shock protein Hsp14 [Natrialbaceae archaeon]